MRFNFKHLKLFFAFSFFSLSLASVAQTENPNAKLLQGKWVLDMVQIEEHGDSAIAIDQSSCYKKFSEIDIKGDDVTALHEGEVLGGKLQIQGGVLFFHFPGALFKAEWTIYEKKLFFEQGLDCVSDVGGMKTLIVLMAYKKKNN